MPLGARNWSDSAMGSDVSGKTSKSRTRFLSRRWRRCLDRCCESLRCSEAVRVGHQLTDFVPVDLSKVEPQRDPTARTHVRRHVEALGIGVDQRTIHTRRGLARDRHDPVAVMIVEEVRELLAAHTEAGVRIMPLLADLRQLRAEPAEPLESSIDSWVASHDLPGSTTSCVRSVIRPPDRDVFPTVQDGGTRERSTRTSAGTCTARLPSTHRAMAKRALR